MRISFARFGFLALSALLIVGCCRHYATVTADVRPTTFPAPVADGRIGPGDLLRVSIGDLVGISVDTAIYVRVSNVGTIKLPLVEPIEVGGLTVEEAETAIAKAFADAKIMPKALVSVEIVPTNIEASTP